MSDFPFPGFSEFPCRIWTSAVLLYPVNLVRTDDLPPSPPRTIFTSDADLVRDVLRGDIARFAELVRRYQRAVLVTTSRVLVDRHYAEDAAQDAFVTAYEQLPKLRDPVAFGAWLLTIARQQAMACSRMRSSRAWEPLPGEFSKRTESDDSSDVLDAVAGLPEHERVIIVLRHFDHHDVASIAQMTGRPIGTVTKQLSRAHQRLRSLLEDEQ